MSVADIRHDYANSELLESSLASDPFLQFDAWFEDALAAKVPEVNAMTLSSVDAKGKPSSRIVLLKGYDAQGFVFFTNYESRKGHELATNPQASLLFFWPALERQVRIEGSISKTSAQESDEYFHSRPLGSRIGAWASPQSRPITREALEANLTSLTASLGEHPQRPEHWGGYRLTPEYVEFWQGRPSRLHDRLVYERNPEGQWMVNRLAP